MRFVNQILTEQTIDRAAKDRNQIVDAVVRCGKPYNQFNLKKILSIHSINLSAGKSVKLVIYFITK